MKKFRVIGIEFPNLETRITVGDFDNLEDAQQKAAECNKHKNFIARVEEVMTDQRTQEILEDNGSTFEPEYNTDAQLAVKFALLNADPEFKAKQDARKAAGDAARARQLAQLN